MHLLSAIFYSPHCSVKVNIAKLLFVAKKKLQTSTNVCSKKSRIMSIDYRKHKNSDKWCGKE